MQAALTTARQVKYATNFSPENSRKNLERFALTTVKPSATDEEKVIKNAKTDDSQTDVRLNFQQTSNTQFLVPSHFVAYLKEKVN